MLASGSSTSVRSAPVGSPPVPPWSWGAPGGSRGALLLVAASVLLRLPSFVNRVFDPDEAAIAVQALVVRDGGQLYIDVIDRKPPVVPLLYSVFFTLTDSTDLRPLRLALAVALGLTAWAVAREMARRAGPVAGWWAGGLFVTGSIAFFPTDAGAVNFSPVAVVPATFAILWSTSDRLHPRVDPVAAHRWAAAAGVALGVAVLCRQSWVVGVVALAISVGLRRGWKDAAIAVGATAATVASVALVVPFSEFLAWTFTKNQGFALASADAGATLLRIVGSTTAFVLLHATLVAAVLHNRRSWRQHADLIAWVLSGLVAVATGLRFFGHYWFQVVPPLVLLAAPALAAATARTRRLAVAGALVPAVAASLALFVPHLFRDRPDVAPIAAVVDRYTDEGDTVFVWGNEPEVLLAAERHPAGALVHVDFVTGRSGGREDPRVTDEEATPGALEILVAALRNDPPDLVIDTTGVEALGYEAYDLSKYPTVSALAREGWTRVAVVDGHTVWVPPGDDR